jgi:hypothetical protein
MTASAHRHTIPMSSFFNARFAKISDRLAREGWLALPRWAARWVYWNAQLYRVEQFFDRERWRMAYKTRRRHKKYGIQNPIVVYQMGKVGSQSVYHSLRALDLDVPVYHLHTLNHLDEYEAEVRQRFANPQPYLEALAYGRKIRAEFEAAHWQTWDLISLVRAPVPRAISEFFQNIETFFPDFSARVAHHRISVQELHDFFLTQFQDTSPQTWFDHQVRELFGLDVYATPFDRARGYQIYQSARVRLLLMRLENLNTCAAHAMHAFLGLENFVLQKSNASSAKEYAALYQTFLDTLRLPDAFVAKMHSTRYARHFYTPEELNASVARWTH